MSWSGSGVFSRSNGVFTGSTVWNQDAAALTNITAANHDTHDQDLADGINACLAKNGENAATGNLPMGGFRHSGVGNATARTMYASVASLQDGGHLYAADSGAADAYVIAPSPSIGAYAAGQRLYFLAANTNTGASTINVNGLGAKSIVKNVASALEAGDIIANGIYEITYDGTNFQLENPPLTRDYGSTGIQADVVAESTSAAGVTADSVLLKDGGITTTALISGTTLTMSGLITASDNLVVSGQAYNPRQTLTYGATTNWNLDSGGKATLALTGNTTMAAPTNMQDGATYVLWVFQDATGSRTITWNSVFKWQNGVAPTLSTGANDFDIITFECNGTGMMGTAAYNFS